MKASTTAKITAIALAVSLAAPLGAMARNRSGDILAGALIGVVAGSILTSAANGSGVYVAPQPVYYCPPPPPPPPPPVYYCPPPPPHRPA